MEVKEQTFSKTMSLVRNIDFLSAALGASTGLNIVPVGTPGATATDVVALHGHSHQRVADILQTV